jgi:hypothetical protein
MAARAAKAGLNHLLLPPSLRKQECGVSVSGSFEVLDPGLRRDDEQNSGEAWMLPR